MTSRKSIAMGIAISFVLVAVLTCNVHATSIKSSGSGLQGLEPVNITEVRSDGTHPMSKFSATAGIWMRPMFDNGEYFVPVDKHIVLEYDIPNGTFPNGFVLAMKAYAVTNDPRLNISIIWQGTNLNDLEHGDVTSANFSRNATHFDGIEEDSLILYVVNESMNGTVGLLVGPAANCTDNNTARFPGIDGDLLYGTRPCLVPIQENAINMTDAEWEAFVESVDQEVLGDLINVGSMDSLLDQLDSLRDILSDGLFGMFGMSDQFDEVLNDNSSAGNVDFDVDFDLEAGMESMVALVAGAAAMAIGIIMIRQRNKIKVKMY